MAASLQKATAGATASNINAAARTVETTIEPAKDVCHLLTLPAELRLEIYETIIANTHRPSVANKTLEPSIMSTCHQIRSEMFKPYLSQIKIWKQELFAEMDEFDMQSDRFAESDLTNEAFQQQLEKSNESWEANWMAIKLMHKKFMSLFRELRAVRLAK